MEKVIKVTPNHYRLAMRRLRALRKELVRLRVTALMIKSEWLAGDKSDEKWLDAQWLRRDAATREYENHKIQWYWPHRRKVESMVPTTGADPRHRY